MPIYTIYAIVPRVVPRGDEMDEEVPEEFTFTDIIESCFFNVVIDFPDKLLPRIRIFTYEDDDDGVKVPFLLYQMGEELNSKFALSRPHLLSSAQARRYESAAQPVSELALGVASAATIVYEWAEKFEQIIGEPLFPTPISISHMVINNVMAEMCFAHGIFYVKRNLSVTVTKPEEEYRPGIYL